MKHWEFYSKSDGRLLGQQFSSDDARMLEANTPEGAAAVEGKYDHLSQRVDLETGQVVDWQPEQPGDDYEWDGKSKRWALKREVFEAQEKVRAAQQSIARLELSQLRPIRELLLDATNIDARAKLAEIDAGIAELRPDLQAVDAVRSAEVVGRG